MGKEKQVKKMNVPHIFIIILCIILLACLATYVAPPGVYDMDETGSAIAGSYHLVEREPVSPWAALLMIKKGIESAASVIILLLVAGGSIAVLLDTGAFNDVLDYGVYKLQDKSTKVLVPAIVVLMSALGAFAGNDSMIAFVTVGLVICARLRLDRITAMGMFYLGYLIGLGSSFTSSMLIQYQAMAGVEPLSGMGARFVVWTIFTAINALYCTRYAVRISRDPGKSLARKPLTPEPGLGEIKAAALPGKGILSIIVMFAVYVLYAVCAPRLGWGQEYLYVFMILSSIFACLLYRVSPNRVSKNFFRGAQSMGGICMVMGLARIVGMVLNQGHVMHTISNAASNLIGNNGLALAAIGIFIFTLVLNLFIPSGMSKAAIMMPLLTPIGDVCGLTRQLVVFAYSLGDNLTNALTPMSGPMVGALELADVDFTDWLKYAGPLMGILAVVSAVLIVVLAAMGWA